MRINILLLTIILLHPLMVSQLVVVAASVSSQIPFLNKQGNATQLFVDGKPFMILGGELGNSTASDLDFLEPHWKNLQQMHLNTVLCPVYWELIEPEEGKLDFTLVDGMIDAARIRELKLVLLWFGSWKNSMSCYAPAWVKTDTQRFPYARTQDGQALEILTPFSEESRNADAKAFAALMKYIRSIDENDHTVIMVQVENEIGMLQDARDYSGNTNHWFSQSVPDELMQYLHQHKDSLITEFKNLWKKKGFQSSGTWEDVFGKGLHTDEIFMAWHYAQYTNFVSQAGKNEYPLPMYVNAALIRPGSKPGQYPSAGPLPHLMDVWRAGAPQIDFLAPDIYFNNFVEWCEKYDRSGNPLFIPEVGNNQSAANAFYALANHNAIGYSPFSIENIAPAKLQPLSQAYKVLHQLESLILANQDKDTMRGVLLDNENQETEISLGNYTFTARHEYTWAYAQRQEDETPRVGGMIIMLAPDEFFIAGSGIIVTFATKIQDGSKAGIVRMEEGSFENGNWTAGRRMNGDQSHQGRHMHLPGSTYGIQRIKLYTYK